MGRLPLPGPFLSSAAAATLAVVRLGDAELATATGVRPAARHPGPRGGRRRRPAALGGGDRPPGGRRLAAARGQAGRGRRAHRRLRRGGGARTTAASPRSCWTTRVARRCPPSTSPGSWPTSTSTAGWPGASARTATRPRSSPGSSTTSPSLCAPRPSAPANRPSTGDRVRQAAGAVRPAHRHLPGHQAQDRRHARTSSSWPGWRRTGRPGPARPTIPSASRPPPRARRSWPRPPP